MTAQRHKLIESGGFELFSTGATFVTQYIPPTLRELGSWTDDFEGLNLMFGAALLLNQPAWPLRWEATIGRHICESPYLAGVFSIFCYAILD